MEKERKMLNFLLLADIHNQQKQMDALKKWHLDNFKDKYDCILIGGYFSLNNSFKGDIDSVPTGEMKWKIEQPACENS